ncbi:MAG: hypothetical protein AAF311_02975 [Pseudomonadota bacterium]
MHKIAIVIYSDLDGAGLSANFRALSFAEELLAAGDEVKLIYDGGGAKSLSKILDPGHRLHRAWTKSRSALHGACRECAKAYKVADTLQGEGIPLLAGFKGHLAFRPLLDKGYQIVTF